MSVELYFDPQVLACEVVMTSIFSYFANPKGQQTIICAYYRKKKHFFKWIHLFLGQNLNHFLNGKIMIVSEADVDGIS